MKHLEAGFYGKNSFGRYLGMTLTIFLGVASIGQIPLLIVILVKRLSADGNFAEDSANMMSFSQYGISNNLGLFLMLLSFVACFFGFWLLIKPIHQRSMLQTINGGRKIRWNHVAMGAIVWGGISLILSLIDYYQNPQDYVLQFDATKFAILLLIVFTILPFQTSFEELFFRGYLAQGIAQKSKNRWIVLIVVSSLFGFMHILNPEVKEYGFLLSMPKYIISGLIFGIISILDDGIETAMGVHFSNNALIALLTTSKASALQTDATFNVENINPDLTDIVYFAIVGVIVVYILSRIYKWNFSIMNKKIKPITPPIPDSFLQE